MYEGGSFAMDGAGTARARFNSVRHMFPGLRRGSIAGPDGGEVDVDEGGGEGATKVWNTPIHTLPCPQV